MRVLALVTDAFGGEGGIARFNRDLLAAMGATPAVERVDVLCRHAPQRQEALPPKVSQAPVAGGRAGYALRAVLRAIGVKRYDVVFCSHLHLAPVAAAAATLQRAPLWLQLHGIESWQRPGRLRRRAAEQAALVTSISRYTRSRFVEWALLHPSKVRVLPGTVDPRFTPGPRPEALAGRLGVRDRRVALTVSRIDTGDRYKGHDTVIAALARLASRVPDLDYVIVGDGDDRGRLERLAQELGVAGRVHFAGRVSDSELIDYYRLADVFVMPSTKEGFGIVFLEAAASGLPVIGGDRDGSADPLADGAIGTLVTPDDIPALASAIEGALAGPRPDPARVARFRGEHFTAQVRALLQQVAR